MKGILIVIAMLLTGAGFFVTGQALGEVKALFKAQDKFNQKVFQYLEQQNVINGEQNSINADLIDTIGAMQQGGY